MNIKVKNLGILRQAEFSLGDMTIICGKNNTGKTYATYAVYGFLSYWRRAFTIQVSDPVIKELLMNGSVAIDINRYKQNSADVIIQGCKAYTRQLPQIFAAPDDRFKNAEFTLSITPEDINTNISFSRSVNAANTQIFSFMKEKDSSQLIITLLVEPDKVKIPDQAIKQVTSDMLKEIIYGRLFPKPFIASAERTGAAIFRNELNFARNRLLEEMSQADKNIEPMELLFKVYKDYALPVKANADFTRQLESISKQDSFIKKQHPEILNDFSGIIGGEYKVTRHDELYYIPKGKGTKLTMNESSSSVRSLLDIGFYLRHIAQKGDILMIDEPELNLHPENQRRLARLFARLVNTGLKIFITTHSDYIIKELNTLIMLNPKTDRLKKIAFEEKYKDEELLDAQKVKAFIAEEQRIRCDENTRRSKCHTLTPAEINQQEGIEARSFDTTIDDMNRIQDEIVWGDR